MISFRNDYSEGAHPSVLEAISKHNFETTVLLRPARTRTFTSS